MSDQLAYAIITSHSLHKSRTGGILARLISRTGLELAAARMFAPSRQLADEYAETIISADDPQDRRIQELIRDYVVKNLGPDPRTQRRRRLMMLLFQGEQAVKKVRSVVGNFSMHRVGGETIRDTYGDLVFDENDQARYFEPAVLAAPTEQEVREKLRLWAKYSDDEGGLLKDTIAYPPGAIPQRTLVLIKPDNFQFPTGRPGNVIDFFSRSGLFIVGMKVHRMSVAEAEQFYGPVREMLRTRFNDAVAAKANEVLERELKLKLGAEETKKIGDILGPIHGDHHFDNIIKFMSGRTPTGCDEQLKRLPGTEKCIALVYEGVEAIRKIREILGPTDPSKAPPGSIRREFGQTVMANAAHASDSEASYQREIQIIDFSHNLFRNTVEKHYGKL